MWPHVIFIQPEASNRKGKSDNLNLILAHLLFEVVLQYLCGVRAAIWCACDVKYCVIHTVLNIDVNFTRFDTYVLDYAAWPWPWVDPVISCANL